MGKTTVLVEFGTHVGDLRSSGLSNTDGDNVIGGITQEFYDRLGMLRGFTPIGGGNGFPRHAHGSEHAAVYGASSGIRGKGRSGRPGTGNGERRSLQGPHVPGLHLGGRLVRYRSLVPKRGECANVLVPVCLSASHMAYGSIRMEPVFMILGQSAATAAVLAIGSGLTVQDVPYPRLRERLLTDQRLWVSGKANGKANK